MNKYSDKSDFEINKAVAIAIGFPCYYGNGSYTNGLGLRAAIVKGENAYGNYMMGGFDPCNNPADAMPIFIKNKMGVIFLGDLVQISDFSGTIVNFGNNFYRTIAELFLMMKDAENES